MPTICVPTNDEETRAAAQILFTNFYRFQQQSSDQVPRQPCPVHDDLTFNTFTPPRTLIAVGEELQRISDEFERSKEREEIRLSANRVNMNNLDYDQFVALLNELFPNGQITRIRIVTLFFFCTDLAKRAGTTPGCFSCTLIKWSLRFICDRVCSWVQSKGGWEVVFGTGVLAVTVVLSVAALVFYLHKTIYTN